MAIASTSSVALIWSPVRYFEVMDDGGCAVPDEEILCKFDLCVDAEGSK